MWSSMNAALSGSQAAQTGKVYRGPGATKSDLPELNSYQKDCLRKARKYSVEQNVKIEAVKQTFVKHQQQQQKQQAMAVLYRSLEQIWTKLGTIYVGSINFDINEDMVREAFLPFGPMRSINLAFDHIANKHKGFAFIEYDIPEAAFLAIDQMNDVMLGGRNIKVGRPLNMPQCQPVIQRLKDESSKYNRIYVSSIHQDLNDNDLRTVFESFGKICSIKMPPDMMWAGKHRGYAFIEFDTKEAADGAAQAMNLFDLGGQPLRVGRALTPPDIPDFVNTSPVPMPTAAAVAAAAVSARLSTVAPPNRVPGLAPPGVVIPQLASTSRLAVPGPPGVVIPQLASAPRLDIPGPGVVIPQLSTTEAKTSSVKVEDEMPLEQQENLQIKGSKARNVMMQKLLRKSESNVMVLRNMVGAGDLDEELESEVTDECGRYGHVKRVIIYQEKQSEADDAEVVVKIFVEFSQTADAEKAVAKLNNRFFAGRRIQAQIYDMQLYKNNDLSS